MLWELAWSQPVWLAVQPPPQPPGGARHHRAQPPAPSYVAHPNFPKLPPSVSGARTCPC